MTTAGVIAVWNLAARIDGQVARAREGPLSVDDRAELVELIALRGKRPGLHSRLRAGCGDGGRACREVPADARSFVTRAELAARRHPTPTRVAGEPLVAAASGSASATGVVGAAPRRRREERLPLPVASATGKPLPDRSRERAHGTELRLWAQGVALAKPPDQSGGPNRACRPVNESACAVIRRATQARDPGVCVPRQPLRRLRGGSPYRRLRSRPA